MKNKIGHLLIVVVVALTAGVVTEPALAESVTYNFTGTVTSVSGTPFGLSPTIGQQVQGSFTYDTSQPPTVYGDTWAGYIQQPPNGMSVVISGVTLQSLNYNSFQVVLGMSVYPNPDIVDDINGFFTPISVDGVPRFDWSYISFRFDDPTLTALSSTALPTSLDFLSFSRRVGTLYDANGGRVDFSIDPPSPPAIAVKIDIKPGSLPNSLSPNNRGRTPVAVLTTGPSDDVTTFDATTVNPATVLFGSTGTEAAPVDNVLEDVDGDGDMDMLLFFETQDTGITCGDTSATLAGKTVDGLRFTGADSVKTVGCM